MTRISFLATLTPTAILLISPAAGAWQQDSARPDTHARLLRGELVKAESQLSVFAQAHPKDDQARFELGTVQLIRGFERLMQSLHRYGFRDQSKSLPFATPVMGWPVPANPSPMTIRYDTARGILQSWIHDLNEAQATLATVRDPNVRLPMRIGLVRMDFNGDGVARKDETFWRVLSATSPGLNVSERAASEFLITFDLADVHWLRGYCHLLAAISETILAYDWRELFEATGHLLFDRVETPHDYLRDAKPLYDFFGVDVMDIVSFVHLLRCPVREPARSKAALEHLQAVIRESRAMWQCIRAETDNDHEWIPNASQDAAIRQMRVSPTMIVGWARFLDEADALLAGKKLIPFWRTKDGRGVNLRRVFLEPREFDLIQWMHGSAATPYLEKGELSSPEVWRELQRAFRGDFLTFAVWFN